MLQTVKNFYHQIQAILANIRYGFPGRKMTVIGVTGTDGKTTTASILYHILQESKMKAACLTTVSAQIAGKEYDTGFHVTTPNSFAVQAYLKQAQKAGVTHFVLETTSHALDQNRVWGIPFTLGILTNITKEHLDYHKTYERYVAAKAKLFYMAQTVILNKDDRSYDLVRNLLYKNTNGKKIITYGLKKNTDFNLKSFPFKTKLIGDFNLYNNLAAIAAARTLGISENHIRKAVSTFTPPVGRQALVYDKAFRIFIDFAHTPNAFKEILPALKKTTPNRLIHVFGSAGERDTFKRPMMGEISSETTDIMILTAEDPRSEPIDKIIKQIVQGIHKSKWHKADKQTKLEKGKKYFYSIPDRKEAIEQAITLAQKGDTVIITGKSHEKSMNYGQGEEAWDEFATVINAIKSRKEFL